MQQTQKATTTDRKKKPQEVEIAYINCKEKFIPVKKIEIKKTTTTVFRLDLQKRHLMRCRNLSFNSFDHSSIIESIPSSIQSSCKKNANTNKKRVIENNNFKMKTYSFKINKKNVREYKQFYLAISYRTCISYRTVLSTI